MITAEIEDLSALSESICDRWGKPPYNWEESRCFLMGMYLGLNAAASFRKADECFFLYALSRTRESLD